MVLSGMTEYFIPDFEFAIFCVCVCFSILFFYFFSDKVSIKHNINSSL